MSTEPQPFPSTRPKPFIFVLMPFAKEFNDIYQFGVKGAVEDVGAYAERIDEQVFSEGMLDRLFSQIARADVLVADMSGRNPNVFYEVGYAHALGKLVLLITTSINDIPFDLKHRQHIVYNGSITALRASLGRSLRFALKEAAMQTRSSAADALSLSVQQSFAAVHRSPSLSMQLILNNITWLPKQFGGHTVPCAMHLRFTIENKLMDLLKGLNRMTLLCPQDVRPRIGSEYLTKTGRRSSVDINHESGEVTTLVHEEYFLAHTIPELPPFAVDVMDVTLELPSVPYWDACGLRVFFPQGMLEYKAGFIVSDH